MRVYNLANGTNYPNYHQFGWVCNINKVFNFLNLEKKIASFCRDISFDRHKNKLPSVNYANYILGHVPVFIVSTNQIDHTYHIKDFEGGDTFDVTIPDNHIQVPIFNQNEIPAGYDQQGKVMINNDINAIIKAILKKIKEKFDVHSREYNELKNIFTSKWFKENINKLLFPNAYEEFEYTLSRKIRNILHSDEDDSFANSFAKELVNWISRYIVENFPGLKIQHERSCISDFPADVPDKTAPQMQTIIADGLYCPINASTASSPSISSTASSPSIFIYIDLLQHGGNVPFVNAQILSYVIAHEYGHAMMDEYLLQAFAQSTRNHTSRKATLQKIDSQSKYYILNEEALATAIGLHVVKYEPIVIEKIKKQSLQYQYGLHPQFQEKDDLQKWYIPSWLNEKNAYVPQIEVTMEMIDIK